MKFLIAGLGNVGDKYKSTRHNIGFDVLDRLASVSEDCTFSDQKRASVAECRFKGKTLLLIKPTTFMNLSGKAVSYWLQKEKIPIENLLVIMDDIALPLGKLRLKGAGSDGGHNGLKSINDSLGRTDYARLRFGIGNNFTKGQQANYVLGEWTEEERPLIDERINIGVDLIRSFASLGVERTMNLFNNKT